ncbi:MAG TPA: YkgJ family cysteine cluster protein [Candidatus Thermoplasmatota archaeon]|nr:YkgJ family cysteine cluster protein [Candidatus Thermoplasmatota archaeon]
MESAHARELEGKAFACLEGCGFCCTFQPEASQRELALLRQRLKPKALPIVVGEGRTYLGLQNKCGACTLLERRACQAYDLRPQHCRYFPFHVHFGARPQVYVNMTCRGVTSAPDGDLRAAYEGAVVANAKPDEWARHEREARETYATFERNARKADAWGDPGAVARAALAEPDVGTRAWMERALARADEEATPDELVADALIPFSAPDVTKRPFYLAPDLRWLTFDTPRKLVEMDERGALTFVRALPAVEGWQDLAMDLRPYLASLVERDVFAGSVYALVDEHDYATTVEEATWFRLAEIVADLNVRARVLASLGVAPDALPDELVRFYDSTFLDTPTIGGFL